MSAYILGFGNSTPTNGLSQEEYCEHAKQYNCMDDGQNKLLEKLYRRTNVSRRYSVLLEAADSVKSEFFASPIDSSDRGPTTAQRMHKYSLYAAGLSARACRHAIEEAAIEINEITHLVTASCTGFSAPGFDVQLFDLLSLNRGVFRTHLGFMGCHAVMNALRAAEGYCALDEHAKILLCATEICSLHFQYGADKNDLIANSLFADGSAALILSRSTGKIQYLGSASIVLPNSEDAITWQISNNGFIMTLSPHINDLIKEHLPSFLAQWLEKYSMQLGDITTWAVHPGGPRILNAVETCLELPSSSLDVSRQVLAEYGNMSSPTVLFILQRLMALGNATPTLMLGFGPGLTIEAALFA